MYLIKLNKWYNISFSEKRRIRFTPFTEMSDLAIWTSLLRAKRAFYCLTIAVLILYKRLYSTINYVLRFIKNWLFRRFREMGRISLIEWLIRGSIKHHYFHLRFKLPCEIFIICLELGLEPIL